MLWCPLSVIVLRLPAMDMHTYICSSFVSMQQGSFVGSLAILTLVLGLLHLKYNNGWALNGFCRQAFSAGTFEIVRLVLSVQRRAVRPEGVEAEAGVLLVTRRPLYLENSSVESCCMLTLSMTSVQ